MLNPKTPSATRIGLRLVTWPLLLLSAIIALVAIVLLVLGAGYGVLSHRESLLNAGEAFYSASDYINLGRVSLYVVCFCIAWIFLRRSTNKRGVVLTADAIKHFIIRYCLYVAIYEIFLAQNIIGHFVQLYLK